MPMTPWEEVAGFSCDGCGKPATHIYGARYLCCACHGGYYFTEEEARFHHMRVQKEKKIAGKVEEARWARGQILKEHNQEEQKPTSQTSSSTPPGGSQEKR